LYRPRHTDRPSVDIMIDRNVEVGVNLPPELGWFGDVSRKRHRTSPHAVSVRLRARPLAVAVSKVWTVADVFITSESGRGVW